MFAAKPARKVVKAYVVKAFKQLGESGPDLVEPVSDRNSDPGSDGSSDDESNSSEGE